MKTPLTSVKARRLKSPEAPAEEDPEVLDARQRSMLEKQYRDSRAAFTSWETAQARTDQQLYRAIGRLAEFAAEVGNDLGALADFAAEKGVRATKASSRYTVITKLVVTTDRRKASKYAQVLQLAAHQGLAPTGEAISVFIQESGGIEACVRRHRDLPRDAGTAPRRGRPSAFSQAVERLVNVGRSPAPAALRFDPGASDYVLIVGVRAADGTLELLHKPVTEDSLVRKAVAALVPKSAGQNSEGEAT